MSAYVLVRGQEAALVDCGLGSRVDEIGAVLGAAGTSGRLLRPVADGEEVFGLQVVDTPGHTPGHIAVFDTDSKVLVAGDAITSTLDGLQGPMREFTADMSTAEASVRKLAALEPQVVLVGHGPPVQLDAAAQLRRLASSHDLTTTRSTTAQALGTGLALGEAESAHGPRVRRWDPFYASRPGLSVRRGPHRRRRRRRSGT